MQIQKTIKLNIERDKKYIICTSLLELQMVMGSSAISGSYHMFKVIKEKGKFKVPIEVVKGRIKKLERDVSKANERLEIMRQVLK